MTTSPQAPQLSPRLLRLSIIVPLAPGETEEAGLLVQLTRLPGDCEVLLIQSAGHHLSIPAGWPADIALRAIDFPAGRAAQLNRGARDARGTWLWFLHADTRLTPSALPALDAFVQRDDPALGWFDLAFRDGPALTRLNAWGANLRSRWLGLPFGDQGLVLPAREFRALGGFDQAAAYGEDHLLVWKAHGARLKLRRIPATLVTSARKYGRHGWGSTTWLHVRLTVVQAFGAWRRMRRT